MSLYVTFAYPPPPLQPVTSFVDGPLCSRIVLLVQMGIRFIQFLPVTFFMVAMTLFLESTRDKETMPVMNFGKVLVIYSYLKAQNDNFSKKYHRRPRDKSQKSARDKSQKYGFT